MTPASRTVRALGLTGLAVAAVGLGACGGDAGGASGASGAASTSAASTGAASSGGGYGGGYGGAAPATTAAASPSGSGRTLALTASESAGLSFTPGRLQARTGKVTLKLDNPAANGSRHGIAVEGNGVDRDGTVVAPGGTSTVSVSLKPGTYTFYCPVPGHRAAGMQGTLTVR